ncbi:Monofunctional biosynthetic peptidoglycan transglycosylase [Hyphomicrobium sulfonivorans]|uniref:Biosynthetic peptidoglycan transglycosylase n=1 Tax=Hyphomicrobium sulfonivorans TaxID=121290 RepID=A0A109BBK3_HYPSL|nr:monofunctional biosynthetic peptidoglycan transglycosylase [Hyphomicrobium sulfonivorans]KWT65783.1 Monofunctional biosynthetic peptidoglycan transglycosylase [Hyphomicrobium sulfonivorans]
MIGPNTDSQPSEAAAAAAGDELDHVGHPVEPAPSQVPEPAPELSLPPAPISTAPQPDVFSDGADGTGNPQVVQSPIVPDEAALVDHAAPAPAPEAEGVPALEPWPDPLETAHSGGDLDVSQMAAADENFGSQAAANFADVVKAANPANEAPEPTPLGAAVAGFAAGDNDDEAVESAAEPVARNATPTLVAAEATAGSNDADAAFSFAPANADTADDAAPFLPEIPEPVSVPDIGAWRAPEPALPSLDAPINPPASKLSLHPDSHSDWTPSIEVAPAPAAAAPELDFTEPDFSRMWSEPQAAAMAAPAFASAAHAADISWQSPSSAASAAGQPERRSWKAFAYRVARIGFFVLVGWFAFVLTLVVLYRFVNPPFSMLMAQQWLTGTSIQKQWVPLEQISPNLQRAVVVSEDSRFCQHWGIDLEEMANAIRRSGGGYPRGASTITMQLAKNLFLLPTKSYLRKMVEVPLTVAIELTWPKARILEVYLNVVEWGPGVFGAEAASRTHFKRPASELTARQAAQLAVSLPNPIVRNAGRPGPLVRKRAGVIQQRAAGARGVLSCISQGR